MSRMNRQVADIARGSSAAQREPIDPDVYFLPVFLRDQCYPVSPWPIFLSDAVRQRELEPLAAALPRLCYLALQRTFGRDGQAFEDYFGYPRIVYDLLQLRSVHPDEVMMRYDATMIDGRVQLLELNCSSSLGGLLHGWYTSAVDLRVGSELRAAGSTLRYRDPFHGTVEMLIRAMQRRPGLVGNIALHCFTFSPETTADLQRELERVYDLLRPAEYRNGRVLLYSHFDELDFSVEGLVRVHGVPADAVLISYPPESGVPGDVTSSLLELAFHGRLIFPDSPMHRLLGDKRVLALLYECCERGAFNADDAALIRRHVPWSRRIAEVEATWQGQQLPLAELLRRERECLVLKRGDSFGGRDVLIGCNTGQAEWESVLTEALSDGKWIAQELLQPGRAELPHPAHGVIAQDIVWGFFAMGTRYCGASVRAVPAEDRVCAINSGRGAVEFMVFEEDVVFEEDRETAVPAGAVTAQESPAQTRGTGTAMPLKGSDLMEFSPLNRRLLDRLAESPGMRSEALPVDTSATASFASGNAASLSPWPVFLSRDIVESVFADIVVRAPRLLYKALFASFRDDADAFALYFGWPPEAYAQLLAAPPDPRDLIGRYDVIFSAGQAKVIEFNCSSAAGGWQNDWLSPLVDAALHRHGVDRGAARYRPIFAHIAQHMVRSILRRRPDCERGNILLYAFPAEEANQVQLRTSLQSVYDSVKPARFAHGRIFLFRDFGAIRFGADGSVWFDGEPMDAVMFTFPAVVPVPDAVYEQLNAAHLAGHIVFPDCASHYILDSKLLLALVHDCAQRGRLTREEKAWVRRHLPWTAALSQDIAYWQGEPHATEPLLLRRQADLVLKRADSSGGRHVFIGRELSAAAWRESLANCRSEGGWIVQDYCSADSFVALHRELGLCEHDLVWGVFGLGRHYGGSMVRAQARAQSGGIVNIASGASWRLVYEEQA